MTTTTDRSVEDERRERGAKLRRIRRSQGIPVAALAKQTDCSAKHIYNLEYGVVRPSVELLVRICRKLDVPFDELALSEDHERINA